MQTMPITDLYEAAYLVLSGNTLESITCIPLSKTLACRFMFSGEAIEQRLEEVRSRSACVNLSTFRSAYSTVNSFAHEAKKSYERERRIQRKDGGEE